MREAIEALNQLVESGTVAQYAIGGAVGAAFYIEAVQTEDLDAFVFLPASASGLALLSPIYAKLVSLGGTIEGAHIRFGDWPVQIVSDANDLIAEAIQHATGVTFEQIPTRVFRAEYLCAIALQTGRTKDMFRVCMFLEQASVRRKALAALIDRFGLQHAAARLPADLWPGFSDVD